MTNVLRANLKNVGSDIMTTEVAFGIILEINGEDVSLEPKFMRQDGKNGVEFFLPRRVEVGTAEDLDSFLKTLTDDNVSLPTGDNFPNPLDIVYKKLTLLNLAVEKLDLKVPPIKGEPTTFTLGLSATWSDNEKVSLIENKLVIKGLYVKLVKT